MALELEAMLQQSKKEEAARTVPLTAVLACARNNGQVNKL